MQPWYWIGIYCFGVLFGTMFVNYLRDMKTSEPLGATSFWIKVSKKGTTRAWVYLVCAFFIITGVLRQKRMVEHPENQSTIGNSVWATFGSAGFALGFGLLIMTMLVGKCRPLLAIFDAEMWQPLAKLAPCISMLGPIACLWFFLSTSSMLNYEFLTQIYYFFGNLAFTLLFTMLMGPISDFPVQLLRQMPYSLMVVRLDTDLVTQRVGMSYTEQLKSLDVSSISQEQLLGEKTANDSSMRETTMSGNAPYRNDVNATVVRDSTFGRFTTFKQNPNDTSTSN